MRAVEDRRRIARPPVDEVEIRIVGTGEPRRAATVAPGFGVPRPSFAARLAGSRHCVGLPCFLAGIGVVGDEEAANPKLTAAGADKHLVLYDERRSGERVSRLPVGYRDIPDDLAALRIERKEMAVERRPKDPISKNSHAAVDHVATEHRRNVLGKIRLVHPEKRSGLRVERKKLAPRRRDIHDAVIDDRDSILASQHAHRERPRRRKLADVGRVDLLEWCEPRPRVVPAVDQPVARILGRAQQSILSHRLELVD